jgi:PTS system N-acetylglucosamine-specific IIC component
VVAYLVTIEGAKMQLACRRTSTAPFADDGPAMAEAAFGREMAKLSVPPGILAGLVAGCSTTLSPNIKLPDYLAFFGGRRFVPIAAGLRRPVGACSSARLPWFEAGIDTSAAGWSRGPIGLFLYWLLNRLLLDHRPAPHPQQHRLVHARRLQWRDRRL